MKSRPLQLSFLEEPSLRFGYGQTAEDPRVGLFTFGPLEERRPTSIRIGVVGTPRAMGLYRRWSERFVSLIRPERPSALHQLAFPGFEAAFRTPWPTQPSVELAVTDADVSRAIRIADRHVAIYETVSLFERPIRRALISDDCDVSFWVVIVPEEVYLLGRPLSRLARDQQVSLATQMNARLARRLSREPSLFIEDMQRAEPYSYDVNFHHQLKSRVLDLRAVVQVVREPSISPGNVDALTGIRRRMQDEAAVAWNIGTAAFFKAGGRPWRPHDVRDGVCYVGMVFKQSKSDPESGNACCGAQLFLDSGDGVVFKGAIGPWYSQATREYHLSEAAACDLARTMVNSYRDLTGTNPSELFIHGRARFNEEEWSGFRSGVPKGTSVACVTIKRANDLKVFRSGTRPVLRGTTYQVNRYRGYLWTTGYIPALGTYPGRETPNPLSIEIGRGDADLNVVMADVFRLTKVNFNSCVFGDGLPVTLRFAESVGEILVASPRQDIAPLPFRHYI